jgi:enoyl-CoA hydratase/carnithine racemase
MTAAYFDRYPSIAFRREDGILEMRIHTRGGPALWGPQGGLHRELGPAFADVANDRENKVVIFTGTGDAFCAGFDDQGEVPSGFSAESWDTIVREGRALLLNQLAIDVPVIAAVNGPAFIHADLAVLADIVLAAESASFADKAHGLMGVVPGDGVHVIWPMLLGPNRGRYFLLTGQEIGAREALSLGIVGEVLPDDRLNARAWELARDIAARPPLATRYTRMLLTQPLRERLGRELATGLVVEGMGVLAAFAGAG